MSCCHPYSAFATGRLTEKNKKELILEMSSTDFLSLSSAQKRGFDPLPSSIIYRGGVPGLGDPVPIPCGSCIGCRMARAKDWTTRLILESRQHKFNYFVTLTYADKSLPRLKTGQPYLEKTDLQKFLKRFRLRLGTSKLRFFACGEYGDLTQRPHFHLILFLDDPLPLNRFGKNRFHCPFISKAWTFGLHEVSNSENGCLAYVAGYCLKKQKQELKGFEHPPFIVMSRKPGIGLFNFNEEDYRDLKVYLEKGKTAFLPTFLRSKLSFYEDMKEELINSSKAAEAVLMDVLGFENKSSFGESRRIQLTHQIKQRGNEL